MKQETINQSNKVGLYGQRVYLYVEQNFDRQLKLEDVASYFHLNKCYFCSVLKKELGKTFSQIVNEVRVKGPSTITFAMDFLGPTTVTLSSHANWPGWLRSFFQVRVWPSPKRMPMCSSVRCT